MAWKYLIDCVLGETQKVEARQIRLSYRERGFAEGNCVAPPLQLSLCEMHRARDADVNNAPHGKGTSVARWKPADTLYYLQDPTHQSSRLVAFIPDLFSLCTKKSLVITQLSLQLIACKIQKHIKAQPRDLRQEYVGNVPCCQEAKVLTPRYFANHHAVKPLRLWCNLR